jgi:type II secretory pathway component PulF
MLDKLFDFLESIRWWILLAIILAGFIFIYWGEK